MHFYPWHSPTLSGESTRHPSSHILSRSTRLKAITQFENRMHTTRFFACTFPTYIFKEDLGKGRTDSSPALYITSKTNQQQQDYVPNAVV